MSNRPRILCVDDEPHVLDGLVLQLRRKFEIVTAPGGQAALDVMAAQPPFAVICSDMRMPGMDGATLLAHARERQPDATRLLLTGHADVDAAVSAINDGQIFRFLVKPCPGPRLHAAFEAAAEQHRLVTAERELLSKTVRTAVQALVDLLALANPKAFGRADRLRRYATELCAALRVADTWSIETAAMLSQVGAITLAPETLDALYTGQPLTDAMQAQVARLPHIADELLGEIPRLDAVRACLAQVDQRLFTPSQPNAADGDRVTLGARILRVVLDFDAHEMSGTSPSLALDIMRSKVGVYDPGVLQTFAGLHGAETQHAIVKDLPIKALAAGMVLVNDLSASNGMLLAARGHEITPRFLERLMNSAPGSIPEPVRVTVRHPVQNMEGGQ